MLKITSDIVRDEFIGTEMKVVDSKHLSYLGLSGKIVGETRNSFSILHKGLKKRLIKSMSVFQFTFVDGTVVEIDGKLLVGSPVNRLKKRAMRLW